MRKMKLDVHFILFLLILTDLLNNQIKKHRLKKKNNTGIVIQDILKYYEYGNLLLYIIRFLRQFLIWIENISKSILQGQLTSVKVLPRTINYEQKCQHLKPILKLQSMNLEIIFQAIMINLYLKYFNIQQVYFRKQSILQISNPFVEKFYTHYQLFKDDEDKVSLNDSIHSNHNDLYLNYFRRIQWTIEHQMMKSKCKSEGILVGSGRFFEQKAHNRKFNHLNPLTLNMQRTSQIGFH
ncbi:hypothetical protein pb186bvf_020339 [Paramecium bursaria]